VRTWLRPPKRQRKAPAQGVRFLVACLPGQSPWLNPLEPQWLHGQTRVVEPERLPPADELADRLCRTFACPHHPHLRLPPQPDKASAPASKKAA
jgi:hypothetical protein